MKISMCNTKTAAAQHISITILIAALCLWLVGCGGGSSNSGSGGDAAPPASLAASGSIQDGPVAGGTLFVFTAETIAAALEAAADAEDRTAALTNADPVASLDRDPADEDQYSLEISGELAGQALFFVLDPAGAEDLTFGDEPFLLESVAIAGEAGSELKVNLTPHTTLSAIQVRNALDPEGDGMVIDTNAIGAEIDMAALQVKEALGTDDLGEPLFPGDEDPFTAEDLDVLESASTHIGRMVRVTALALGVDREAIAAFLAADAADGEIDGEAGPEFDLSAEEADSVATVAAFVSLGAADEEDSEVVSCAASGAAMRRACQFDAVEALFESLALCSDSQASEEELGGCLAEANDERAEVLEECDEIFEARLEVCEALDDQPHNPAFGPASSANFVDPLQIGVTVTPHAFFPLVQGNRWVYEGTFEDDEGEEVTETITVTVTDKTKLIEGITCLVVNDLVEEDGEVIEDTDDWYAQDVEGNLWYCGEIAENFETFEGDVPEAPELVDIEGSWKAGREGAKAGILLPAAPEEGDVIRQEILLDDAEDVVEILNLEGTESSPAASCAGTCLVTKDFTPLEPGEEENKYYAPNIGLIVEVDLESGERVELIEFVN